MGFARAARLRRPALPLAAAVLVAGGSAAALAGTGTFQASYDGTFTVTAGVLEFHGNGAATGLGMGTVDGRSVLVPAAPTADCQPPRVAFTIADDSVTLTGANGDKLFFVNSGTDCLDPATGIIVARATYEIVGGSGRFTAASGTGTVTVVAQCASSIDCTSGTFRDLNFDGAITRP